MTCDVQFIKKQKDADIYSRCLILKCLCNNTTFDELFRILQETNFGPLNFEYMDLCYILKSELTKENKERIINYLIINNKLIVNSQLLKFINSNDLEKFIDQNIDKINIFNRWSLINYLRLLTYNSKYPIPESYKLYTVSVGKSKVIYLPTEKLFIYKDFDGSFFGLLKYLGDTILKYKIFLFGLKCKMF